MDLLARRVGLLYRVFPHQTHREEIVEGSMTIQVPFDELYARAIKERDEARSKLESVYSALRRVVSNFSMHRPLLPDPELPQDLAFLCHVINGQKESLNAALKSSVEDTAELERAKLQVGEWVSASADLLNSDGAGADYDAAKALRARNRLREMIACRNRGVSEKPKELCRDGKPHNYEPNPDTETVCCRCMKERVIQKRYCEHQFIRKEAVPPEDGFDPCVICRLPIRQESYTANNVTAVEVLDKLAEWSSEGCDAVCKSLFDRGAGMCRHERAAQARAEVQNAISDIERRRQS